MKGKKLLVGIMSASVLLSAMTTPIFAEAVDPAVDENVVAPGISLMALEAWADSADTSWYNDTATEFTLTTAAQLAGLAQLVNGGTSFSHKTVNLGNDIDLAGKEWTPIGMDNKSFQGIFDGQGKKISNLTISGNNNNAGLFGYTTVGEVKNFTLENVSVEGHLNVGAVAGTPYTSDYSDITVQGLVQVKGYAYVGGAFGKNAYGDLENIDVIGNSGSYVKADSAQYRTYVGGLVGFLGEGNHIISDCDVKIDVTGSTCDVGGITGILHYGNKMVNCTYEGSLALTNADPDDYNQIGGLAGTYLTNGSYATNIEDCSATVNKATIKNSTIDEDITDTISASGEVYAPSSVTAGEYTIDAKVNERAETYSNYAAKIGLTLYNSFDEAFAAATDGATITLLADASLSTRWYVNKKLTIDLNKRTLTMPDIAEYGDGAQYYFIADTTFKNGTINITKGATTAVFYGYDNDPTLTLDNVVLNANNIDSNYIFGNFKSLNIIGGSKINVNSTNGNTVTAIIASNGDNMAVNIEDSTIDVDNITGKVILWGNVSIKGKSLIEANIIGDAIRVGGTFEGEALNIEATPEGAPVLNITVANDDKTRYGILLADDTSYVKAESATVNSTVYRTPAPANLADTVKVSFSDVTAEDAEGEKVYELYIEADSDKTINRLTSAQLAFVLDTTDNFSYVISGTDKVTVSQEDGLYLFNFDGKTAADATGFKIQLGQIKVTGYGTFSFKVDETKANQAHATTLVDNIVTDFVAEPATGQGRLDINSRLNDVVVAKPTRELTINVSFPNAVQDNVKSYQDMRVIINGGEVNETIRLGSEEVSIMGVDTVSTAMTNGAYVIKRNLVKDMPYTVTVEGGGYRTASYTVRLSEDKTLNFWNNVKTTAANVEENKASSAKTTTFLAGELVKDGKINLYDLSAVVSYFGAKNLKTAHPEYAKYDLNRDGKIDSKDVSYILSSWGN